MNPLEVKAAAGPTEVSTIAYPGTLQKEMLLPNVEAVDEAFAGVNGRTGISMRRRIDKKRRR